MTRLVYDAWNRLVTVKNGGSTLTNCKYDALGRRIVESPSGTAHDLYYGAGWQILEERWGGVSTATIQYVWSPAYVDALVLRDRSTANNGTLDERLWVQQDANWNVTALMNGSGSVVERYVYDPYGKQTVLDASFNTRSSSSYAFNIGFQGTRLDTTSRFNYFRNRDLSPTMGRFIQTDPTGFGGGDPNFYRYVANGPTNRTDPSGLKWVPVASDAPDGGRYRLYHGQWYKWVDGPTPPVTPQKPAQPSAPYNPANDPFHPNFDVSDFLARYHAALLHPHDNRNFWNQVPSFDYAKSHWVQCPDKEAKYHRIGPGNENNLKFVSPDGHFEAVFGPNGTLVIDRTNAGTYNFSFDPYGGFWGNVWPHGVVDVIPYWLWGNGPVFGPEPLPLPHR